MFHPDRQAGTGWTQEILPLAREEKSNKDTHTSALSPYVRHTHTHACRCCCWVCATQREEQGCSTPTSGASGRKKPACGWMPFADSVAWTPCGWVCDVFTDPELTFLFYSLCVYLSCQEQIMYWPQFSCKEFDIVGMSASFYCHKFHTYLTWANFNWQAIM